VGVAGGEHRGEQVAERVVGLAVGPEREHASGVDAPGESAEAIAGVEGAVARVKVVARCVVDVEENGMMAQRRSRREAIPGGDDGEEVGLDQLAAWVFGEPAGVGGSFTS
jgi:hypothetical protein